MKLRNPWLIRGAGFVAAALLRGWMSTVRIKLDVRACGKHPVPPRVERFIYAFWHESILFSTKFRTRIYMLISQHADGELIAQVCKHLRVQTVRGSTTRGGEGALLQMVKAARHAHLGITPDGPRGPRRKVQPGVISLASMTGLPILSFGVGFVDAWRVKSWDRFAIPKLHSTMTAVGAPPLYVPADIDRPGLELYRQELETRMLTATASAERWASGKPLGASPFAGNFVQGDLGA